MTTPGGDAANDLLSEISHLWRGRIVPIRPEFVYTTIPRQVRHLLTTIGLPTSNCWDIDFHHTRTLLEQRRVAGRDLVAIADDHGAPIVVDVVDGSVWKMVPGVREPLNYFNSDLATFLLALGRYDAAYDNLMDWPPSEARKLVDDLRAEFAARDPKSLAAGAMWRLSLDEAAKGSP